MTWDELKRTGEWTPGRIWKLRALMGKAEAGEDAPPMYQKQFADLLSTSHMSIVRWESGQRKPMPSAKRILVEVAEKRLHPWQLEEIAGYEGASEYEASPAKSAAAVARHARARAGA